MARIAGVDLPNKRIIVALTYIFGIGPARSKEILLKAKIDEITQKSRQELKAFVEKSQAKNESAIQNLVQTIKAKIFS